MNCPKCNYSIFRIYSKVIEIGRPSKYCKITNVTPAFSGDCGTDWVVECVCPECDTEFCFSDGDY